MGMQEIYEVDDPCLYIEEIDRLLTDALYFKNATFQKRKIIESLVFQYKVINFDSDIYQASIKDYDRVTNTLLEAGVLSIFDVSSDYKYASYGSMRFRNSDFQDCDNFIFAKEKYERLMNPILN